MIWDFGCLGFRGFYLTLSAPVRRVLAKDPPLFLYLHCCAKSFKFHVFPFIEISQLFPEPFSETFRQCLFLGSVSPVFLQQFQSFRSYIKFFEIFWISFFQCE